MHAALLASAHLVPIIARQLQLGPRRQFDLGKRRKVVEPGLPRCLLLEEPAQLVFRRVLGQPGEERVALAGAGLLQSLEPVDETVGIGRRLRCLHRRLRAELLEESAFQPQHRCVAGNPRLPIHGREAGSQPLPVPLCQTALENIVEELRAPEGLRLLHKIACDINNVLKNPLP
jgi:hypothetical protein